MGMMKIRRFFLGITTHCNMSCFYCFVKDTNEFMAVSSAKRYLRFFLKSAGQDKLLYLYGGEPLIYFDFIKKIIPFFYHQAQKLEKIPSVIIVTNGTIFNKAIADFILQHKIKLMISLSGQEKSHNLFRKFKNGRDTFRVIKKNLAKFEEVVEKKDLWVSYTLHPLMLANFYKDFFYLIKLGFKNIHFEPVQYTPDVYWNNSQLAQFRYIVNSVFDFIEKNISKNKFYFNSKVIRDLEIFLKIAPKEDFLYSIYNNLRVWPRSKLAFSHFTSNLGEKYFNYRELFEKGFLDFTEQLPEKDLEKIFHSSIEIDSQGPAYFKAGERVWHIYDRSCKELAKKLIRRSQRNKNFKKYIQEALKRAI
jgi:organic radical activating enzyme